MQILVEVEGESVTLLPSRLEAGRVDVDYHFPDKRREYLRVWEA